MPETRGGAPGRIAPPEQSNRPWAAAGHAAAAVWALLALLLAAPAAAELSFHDVSLSLPGAPAALVPADLDGDGRRDLAVVVVYTEWEQRGIEEWSEMDQVKGLVEVLTVVPTLMDRREVRVYLADGDGGYRLAGEPLPLPLDVLTLEAGPPGLPVVALTDGGVAELVLDAASGALAFEPRLEERPVLAGTGSFLADLDLVRDVSGDGVDDLLLPAADGLAVYRGTGTGLEPRPAARVPYPRLAAEEEPEGGPSGDGDSGWDEDGWDEDDDWDFDGVRTTESLARDVPLPGVADVDGDGRPDLVFRTGGQAERVALQRPDGTFAPAVEVAAGEGSHGLLGSPVHLGPVDARPGAELVTAQHLGGDEDGVREAMRQVRAPRQRLHVHALHGLAPEPEPLRSFEVEGWVVSGDDLPLLPGGFLDLNGDGRSDLVTVTNDVSVLKAMKVLATKRLKLELTFHPWCQGADGAFRRAPGEPMSSVLLVDLNDLEIHQRSLFAADFDGDGRRDYLELGRPRRIGVHRGRADCSYPRRPDATVRLSDELRDLALAATLDLDGDGDADLAVTHPARVDEPGVSPPVRLDLYLSRSGGAEGGGR